jgi:pimeloyl-ACP methyl ester carboxylesterase
MNDPQERAGHLLSAFTNWHGGDPPAADGPPRRRRRERVWRRRAWRLARWVLLTLFVFAVAVTAASLGYNQSTDGPAPRPPGLLMARGGGFDTRYLEWGTSGPPIVLVPGAFETAGTFAALGPVLAAAGHRVFAIDLTGTGYSAPSPPYDAAHLAAQLLAFLTAKGLTGADAPVLIGHSSGAAVVGAAVVGAAAASGGTRFARGVVFLDGDATPLGAPAFLGWLLINPYRTSLLRLALSQDWLIRRLYRAQCGPACPPLSAAGVQTRRLPLQQPGFASAVAYTLRHGIPSMTSGEFAGLRALAVPKLVIYGFRDPQMSAADAAATAGRIGAPVPVAIAGRHLTMISSPRQLASALRTYLMPS